MIEEEERNSVRCVSSLGRIRRGMYRREMGHSDEVGSTIQFTHLGVNSSRNGASTGVTKTAASKVLVIGISILEEAI